MKYFLLILFFVICGRAQADFEFYRGVRQMGMGGAAIAVVNDETSILINPNGLGRLRDYFYTFADPELTNSIKGGGPLVGTGVFGSIDPQQLYDNLNHNVDQPYYFKGQVFPSVVVPNFGIGLLGKYEILAQRNTDGTFNYSYLNDYALVTGFNLRFWGGRVKVGFSGKLINRTEYSGVLTPGVDTFAIGTIGHEGMGLGVDGGLTLAAPWKWLPTLSGVIRDMGGTSFTMSDGLFGNGTGNTAPNYVPYKVDVAVALFPIVDNHLRSTFTIEYRDILNKTDTSNQMDRAHAGMEINFSDAFFFRGGYGAQHWTAGFEYASSLFQFQLATYGENIDFSGLGTNRQEDRRWILKLAFRR